MVCPYFLLNPYLFQFYHFLSHIFYVLNKILFCSPYLNKVHISNLLGGASGNILPWCSRALSSVLHVGNVLTVQSLSSLIQENSLPPALRSSFTALEDLPSKVALLTLHTFADKILSETIFLGALLLRYWSLFICWFPVFLPCLFYLSVYVNFLQSWPLHSARIYVLHFPEVLRSLPCPNYDLLSNKTCCFLLFPV